MLWGVQTHRLCCSPHTCTQLLLADVLLHVLHLRYAMRYITGVTCAEIQCTCNVGETVNVPVAGQAGDGTHNGQVHALEAASSCSAKLEPRACSQEPRACCMPTCTNTKQVSHDV